MIKKRNIFLYTIIGITFISNGFVQATPALPQSKEEQQIQNDATTHVLQKNIPNQAAQNAETLPITSHDKQPTFPNAVSNTSPITTEKQPMQILESSDTGKQNILQLSNNNNNTQNIVQSEEHNIANANIQPQNNNLNPASNTQNNILQTNTSNNTLPEPNSEDPSISDLSQEQNNSQIISASNEQQLENKNDDDNLEKQRPVINQTQNNNNIQQILASNVSMPSNNINQNNLEQLNNNNHIIDLEQMAVSNGNKLLNTAQASVNNNNNIPSNTTIETNTLGNNLLQNDTINNSATESLEQVSDLQNVTNIQEEPQVIDLLNSIVELVLQKKNYNEIYTSVLPIWNRTLEAAITAKQCNIEQLINIWSEIYNSNKDKIIEHLKNIQKNDKEFNDSIFQSKLLDLEAAKKFISSLDNQVPVQKLEVLENSDTTEQNNDTNKESAQGTNNISPAQQNNNINNTQPVEQPAASSVNTSTVTVVTSSETNNNTTNTIPVTTEIIQSK